MSKGNSETAELIQRIEQARDALDAALKILGKRPGKSKLTKAATAPNPPIGRSSDLDFTMPLRAFVKKNSSGLNGAKKFVLLVAHLTKGNSGKAVGLSEIEASWNTVTANGLLGMKFNRLYTSQARENDWVTTEKMGAYRLRPSWKAIFNG